MYLLHFIQAPETIQSS